MSVARVNQFEPYYLIILPLCALILLILPLSADAFFNRNYSTLEQSQPIKGDFDKILAYGKLRILVPQDFTSVAYLPRRKSPLAEQQRIAEEFALSHGLIPELIIVKNFAELIPALQAGKGDVIINNLTINAPRLKKISFSVSVAHVREQIIVRKSDDRIVRVRDLNGKTVMVNRDSTFWHALQWLKQNKYPDIELLAAPDNVTREEILDRLAVGEIDATILDSNLVEIFQGYRDDFKVADNFSGQRDIAWGIRKDAPQLVDEINRYLQLEHLSSETESRYTDDFNGIKKRKVLRVLLRNSAASYFLHRGELMGFEYELAQEFARFHNLRLEVVVPPTNQALSSWLLEGKADLAMAFLEADTRQQKLGIAFTQPYHYTQQHIVVNRSDKASQLAGLSGHKITIRRGSRDWQTLTDLQRQGAEFELIAGDDAETEQFLEQVASGDLQATLADEHILDIELARSLAVKSALTLPQQVAHSIAIRSQNRQLRKQLDGFIKRIYKSEFYNVLYAKYFKSRKSMAELAAAREIDTSAGQITPFDPLLRKHADKFGFDWRLIAAQMFQESGFNPQAKSSTGARGLMQLMPRTARSLGISNVEDPEHSILGGVTYMDWLRDRFDDSLSVSERLWFSLAAYNAGIGHVHDARRLAKHLGHDPNRWFDHTESAMLLLSKKEYAKKARYGFVNGREPVNYVRQIRERFEAYVELGGSLLSGNTAWFEFLALNLQSSQTD